MLVSPTESNPGEDNGWDFADLMFWEPLLRQHRTLLRNKSLGQLIHHFFPRLKYAAVIAQGAFQYRAAGESGDDTLGIATWINNTESRETDACAWCRG